MPKIFQTIINLLALAVAIYVGVDLFYVIVRAQLGDVQTKSSAVQALPVVKGREKHPLSYYGLITERNLFGSKNEVSQEIREEDIEELQPTSLKLALLGTVAGDERHGFAVIEESNKRKQGLYKVGDTVQGATVRKILRGKVVLRVNDKDEILMIEEKRKPQSESRREPRRAARYQRPTPVEKADTVTVSRSSVEESLENIHELLSQVRIRPHFRDGRAEGLAVSNVRPGSFFAKMGLKNGDVVQGIDGREIKSPDDVLEVYEKMKSGSQVALEIERRGEKKIINYQFK
jgi:general secretion pathway protein C